MLRATAVAFLLASPSLAQLATLSGTVVDFESKPVAARIAVAEVGRATILLPNPTEMLLITPGETGEIRKRCSRIIEADSSGRFSIPDLQPGRYALVAAHAERGIAVDEVEVAADATGHVLALEAPRFLDVDVRGLAFDPSKHVLELKPAVPLGNVSVVPRLVQNGWNFRAGPLPAIDSWRVVGTELVLDHDYRAPLFERVVEVPAGSASKFIDFTAGTKIGGAVRVRGAEALAGVSVTVRSALTPDAWVYGAITDSSGGFERRVPTTSDGRYVLEVRRWIVRDAAGCGNGPADVVARREVQIDPGKAVLVNIVLDGLEKSLADGALAPDFEAPTLAGATLKLGDLRGKVVLVDFWATWCAMCRADLPELEKFYAERSKDGRFEIVAVSIDDDIELLRRFLASRKLPWPQIGLGPVETNPITRLYNVWGTPNTVLIDRDGKIAARNLMGAELRKRIDELLARR